MKNGHWYKYSFAVAIIGVAITASGLVGCGARKDPVDSTTSAVKTPAQAQAAVQQQIVQSQSLEQQLKTEGFEFNLQAGDQVYLNAAYRGYTSKVQSLLTSYVNLAYEALTNLHLASGSDDMNYPQGSPGNLIIRKLQISQRFMATPVQSPGAAGYNPPTPSWE